MQINKCINNLIKLIYKYNYINVQFTKIKNNIIIDLKIKIFIEARE